MDWNGFYGLSEELSDRDDEPGALRTSVSRAYYACLNLTRQHLEARHGFALDRSEKADSSHVQVAKALRERVQGTELADLYDDLRKLKHHRVTCDYEHALADPKGLCDASLRICDRIIKGLKTLERGA